MRLFVKDRTEQSSSQVMKLTESSLKPRSVIENEIEIFNEITLSFSLSASHALQLTTEEATPVMKGLMYTVSTKGWAL